MEAAAIAQPAAPLVTVITPCRNAAGSLERCLASVEAVRAVLQRHGERLEHWIVDGNSSDGTTELVRQHCGRHAGCRWLEEVVGGPYAGMQAGLQRAQGRYVHILNADDVVLQPKAYGEALLAAQAQAAACILASMVYVRPGQERVVARWRVKPLPAEPQRWQQQLRAGLHYPHPGFIAERLRYQCPGFDLSLRYAADYKLMQTLLLALEPAQVLVVQEPLVAMATGGHSGGWAGRVAGRSELARINRELGLQGSLWRRYLGKLWQRCCGG